MLWGRQALMPYPSGPRAPYLGCFINLGAPLLRRAISVGSTGRFAPAASPSLQRGDIWVA